MIHKERNDAKRYDSPNRNIAFTKAVYNSDIGKEEGYARLQASIDAFKPEKNAYNLYFGDLHGHTNLSDGGVDPDVFFTNMRDLSKADFCALSDHDHGGVGRPMLWEKEPESGRIKWDIICDKADEYYEPGRFTTILAYERDSYPWYSNMVLYFRDRQNAQLYRGEQDGEITREELLKLRENGNVIFGPHTCSTIDAGCYFVGRDAALMPDTFEIFSSSGAYEYYMNPFPPASGMRGGNYIDALDNGAHPACIACSDNHDGRGGRDIPAYGCDYGYTGLTGVYAEANTREALFDALKARRCYAFMGEKRIGLDFRINGHYMGEIISDEDDKRTIYYKVESEVPVKFAEVIKNGESVVFYRGSREEVLFDYKADRDEDYYYLRVTLEDGRLAWTSPIWIRK